MGAGSVADQLCEPEDLASLLEMDLDSYKANMLVECATAVVQAVLADPAEVIAGSGVRATVLSP